MGMHRCPLFFFPLLIISIFSHADEYVFARLSTYSDNDHAPFRCGFSSGKDSNYSDNEWNNNHSEWNNAKPSTAGRAVAKQGWSHKSNPTTFSELTGIDIQQNSSLFLALSICNEFDIPFFKDKTIAENFAALTVEQQNKILSRHEYYSLEDFVNVVKQMPHFSQHMKELYKHYNRKRILRGFRKWYKRQLGDTPWNIEELHKEAVRISDKRRNEQEERQRKEKGKQQQLAKIAAQKKKFEKEKKKRFDHLQDMQVKYKDTFEDLMDEYQDQLYDFGGDEDGFGYNSQHKNRLECRYQALQKSCDNNFSISKKEFPLTSNASKIINRFSLDRQAFVTCEGSDYQHAIHAELISMLDSLGNNYVLIQANSTLSSLTETTVSMISLAQEANSSALTKFATKATDLCFALLDCTIGAVEGIGDGIVNTIHTFTHPIESIQNLCSSIKTAGYHVALFLKELEEVNVALEMGEYDAALAKNKELSDRIYSNITAVCTIIKEASPRDIARGVTAFVTEGYLIGKGLKICGQFLSKAQNTALPKLQKVKGAALAHYKDLTHVPAHEFKLALAGEAPEILLAHETVESLHNLYETEKAIAHGGKGHASVAAILENNPATQCAINDYGFHLETCMQTTPNNTERVRQFLITEKETFDTYVKAKNIIKCSDKYRDIIPSGELLLTRETAAHVLFGEVRTMRKASGKIKQFFSGGHWNPNGIYTKAGIYSLENVKPISMGCYEAQLKHFFTNSVKYKTLYSDGWSINQVMDAFYSSLRNPCGIPRLDKNRWQLFGKYKNVIIQTIVDQEGLISSFYPIKKVPI